MLDKKALKTLPQTRAIAEIIEDIKSASNALTKTLDDIATLEHESQSLHVIQQMFASAPVEKRTRQHKTPVQPEEIFPLDNTGEERILDDPLEQPSEEKDQSQQTDESDNISQE